MSQREHPFDRPQDPWPAHTTGAPVLRPVVPQYPQVRRCILGDEQKPVARPPATEVLDEAPQRPQQTVLSACSGVRSR